MADQLVNSVDRQAYEAELKAVLATPMFARAPGLSRLFAYLCEQSLSGRAQSLNEYTIAVDGLGRDPTFDPNRDSIVRVEASRLRKRLVEYYAGEGAGHRLKIVPLEGGYSLAVVPQKSCDALADAPHGAPEEARSQSVLDDMAEAAPELHQSSGNEQVRAGAPPHRQFGIGQMYRRSLLLAIAAFLCAGGVLFVLWRARTGSRAAQADMRLLPSGSVDLARGSAENVAIRIVAGSTGGYIDVMGRRWLADRYFTGGAAVSRAISGILGTYDKDLYRTVRIGQFRYDIPLKPGVYELHLDFAEVWEVDFQLDSDGEDNRRFRVLMNDTPVLDSFDVVADAYGPNTADEKVFKNVSPAPDGFLHLEFAPDVSARGSAFLSAIEILPGTRGKMLPVRIVCGAASYYDADARSWSADRYFLGGVGLRRLLRTDSPAGAAYPAERYGNFRYAIPVADGSYTVKLRFVEAVFGFGTNSGPGGGKRVFDVFCNGLALMRNFDIYQQAGGAGIPIEETFRHLRPNGQGKLVLSFVPVRNYATVSTIEVEDEGLQ